MGFTKQNDSIAIERLTQTGTSGFWWVEKDGLNQAQSVGYVTTGKVESAGQLFGADTFADLLAVLFANSIAPKDIDNPINVDEILVQNNIENQVLGLSNNALNQIKNNFSLRVLIFRWANPLLGVAYFRKGEITWAVFKTRIKQMGARRKLKRNRLVQILDLMVANSDITQAQKTELLTEWDNDNL